MNGTNESAARTEDSDALFSAIAAGDAAGITTLLDASAALTRATNDDGISPIMWSLYHRKPESADLILAAGAVPTVFESCALGDRDAIAAALDTTPDLLAARSPDGFTLLHLACFFDHEDLVADLIERGGDVNAIADNPSRVAPIHSAAACASTPIVTMLLEAGADPNATQTGGVTVLMSVALHGYAAMAETLLAHGADPTLAMDDGRTAIDLAREGGHTQLAARLSNP